MKKILNYLKQFNISEQSKILNITHCDLDGLVSTINLKNYFRNVVYFQKNYDTVNKFFTDTVFQDNCSCKDYKLIIVTDISLNEDVVQEALKRNIPLIVLDHHATVVGLNKFENCFIDETKQLSGADVTLQFIKALGYNSDKLDKLNRIATEFDLYLFKKDTSLRKFEIHGKKQSLAEMLNMLYFATREKDNFLERWKNGWEKGFCPSEVAQIKKELLDAKIHKDNIVGTEREILLDNKVIILSDDHINYMSDYYFDENNYDLMITYNVDRNKIGGRVSEKSKINIGKIFEVMKTKSYVTTAGGHEKAGGCFITDYKYFQEFVEKVIKLAEHYER